MTAASASPTIKQSSAREVYLASRSRTRAKLLTNAGIVFTAEPAAVDEAEVKSAMWAEGANTEAAAAALAVLKARKVSNRHPQALVIGSDQILDCDGVWFDKPTDMENARAQLQNLRGRTHRLVSDTCVFLQGARLWSHGSIAELVMRDFSDGFLDDYLKAMGPGVLDVVGGYEIEGLGAQLFTKISGDFFSILGLPLLPLLDFLRGHGVVGE
ncbi:MAG TPA: Maf family protein [Alphaproteobacteria bacterium]|jgi:septum formation protein|nr:Maf family protein [Alphaproteobacteria bacterium]